MARAGRKSGAPRKRRAPAQSTTKKAVTDSQMDDAIKKRDSRCVDDMDRDQLDRYATEIGIRPIDIRQLSDDRLRQNIRAHLAEWFDNLTSDVENAA